ncbi:hypothetical protein SmJEL517_g05433 [Synchytrium microbalum]|uniref:Peptidase S8/S53 domain-containing protein n=1 Tax=Synchytrium microbalum TaxID=1806994 RepID=A0A507BW99_9FUNG|nr:uncharacterized protein SmJEL517_g05433 [Synchytrium microbalum]TPX31179.1 hypothetical protein SmJEL517_g05433 [Synchytrium microbalum]
MATVTHQISSQPVPHYYLVELTNPAVLDGEDTATIAQQQQEFLAHVASIGIPMIERARFKLLFNGFSVKLPINATENADRIANAPMVRNVFPLMVYERPKIPVQAPDDVSIQQQQQTQQESLAGLPPLLSQVHDQTGVSTLHAKNITGRNIRIGIIDTGIDYRHPAFGSCRRIGDLPPCRVAYGYDFVGNGAPAFDVDGPTQLIGADVGGVGDDPMDCSGHGTHVAGIAAASLTPKLVGVAPDALIGAYKVFGCTGGATSDAIIQAMEKAHSDGIDVVNLSIGGGSTWPGVPEARAAAALARSGVIVIAAQGNDGADGLLMSSSPGVASNVISVGATETNYFLGGLLSVSTMPSQRIQWAGSVNPPILNATITLAYEPKSMCSDADMGQNNSIHKNKLVLVRRGVCTVANKAKKIQKMGGVGLVLWNSQPDLFKFALNLDESSIPVFGVSGIDGQLLHDQIVAANYTAQVVFHGNLSAFPNPSGGQVAEFSSFGPSKYQCSPSASRLLLCQYSPLHPLGPDLTIKPNIGAPGALILSSFLSSKGSYAVLSGTSMASPYSAGVSALLASRAKSLNQSTPNIKSTLESTSNTIANASIVRQGAGSINAVASFSATAIISPTLINLGDEASTRHSRTVQVNMTSIASYPITYQINHQPMPAISASQDPWMLPALTNDSYHVSVTIAPSRIEVLPNSTRSVDIEFRLPHDGNSNTTWYYGGFITYTPVDSNRSNTRLHSTYLGLSKNASTLPVFPSNGSSPRMIRQSTTNNNNNLNNNNDKETIPFTSTSSTTPPLQSTLPKKINFRDSVYTISMVFLRPAREASVYMVPYDNPTQGRLVDRLKWIGRSSAKRVSRSVVWDGIGARVHRAYKLVIKVVKAGDGDCHAGGVHDEWSSEWLNVTSVGDPLDF